MPPLIPAKREIDRRGRPVALRRVTRIRWVPQADRWLRRAEELSVTRFVPSDNSLYPYDNKNLLE